MEQESKIQTKSQRYRARKRAEKFGPNAGDMRGKHGNHARASRHPKWNAGKILSDHGYIKVRVGRDHPLADPNGYAYEHLLVWASSGRPMPTEADVIHHKDEDKSNNRLSNLELLTREEHGKLHISSRIRNELTGRLVQQFPEVRHV